MKHPGWFATLGVGGFLLLGAHGVLAQTVNPLMPAAELTAGQVLVVATNLGLSGVFLYFLLHSLRRQTDLEELTRRHEDSARLSRQTFRDTMEAYRVLVSDLHASALANVQIQTRLMEKLSAIDDRLGRAAR